jgi:hypothetical protein
MEASSRPMTRTRSIRAYAVVTCTILGVLEVCMYPNSRQRIRQLTLRMDGQPILLSPSSNRAGEQMHTNVKVMLDASGDPPPFPTFPLYQATRSADAACPSSVSMLHP